MTIFSLNQRFIFMNKVKSLIVLLSFTILAGCNSNSNKNKNSEAIVNADQSPKERLSFDEILGIKYYEVKRRFSNGLSFDEQGFQQEPSWIIQFHSNDSVLAYSPQKKIMQGFHLHYDHGDVYNFAAEWFRIKAISKDSLNFQRLEVNTKKIANDIRSDVNITYYSEDYIKNKLRTTQEELIRPTRMDTLFIQRLVRRANRNPANRDSAFAGRQPVIFTPRSDIITVRKLSMVDKLKGRRESFDYLYPRYKITINKAYKDFSHDFMAVVDQNGAIHLTNILGILPEDYESKKKVIEGIINVYLKNLLEVKPGTTLGIPHPSEINLMVSGKKMQ